MKKKKGGPITSGKRRASRDFGGKRGEKSFLTRTVKGSTLAAPAKGRFCPLLRKQGKKKERTQLIGHASEGIRS